MDDSSLYTGVDNEGIFGNEKLDTETQDKLDSQVAMIRELTPKLQQIVDMIDFEIKTVMSIDRFANATIQPEVDIRAELQASAQYKKYLDGLKTKFTLILNETTK